MDVNPGNRIGINNKDEIKYHPFFKGINWDLLLKKRYKPPSLKRDFTIELSDLPKILINDEDYLPNNKKTNRVKNFSFEYDKKNRLSITNNKIQSNNNNSE